MVVPEMSVPTGDSGSPRCGWEVRAGARGRLAVGLDSGGTRQSYGRLSIVARIALMGGRTLKSSSASLALSTPFGEIT